MKISVRFITTFLLLMFCAVVFCQQAPEAKKKKKLSQPKEKKSISQRVDLSWKPAKDAAIYQVQVCIGDNFKDKWIEVDKIVSSPNTKISLLALTKNYHWRVRAGSYISGRLVWSKWTLAEILGLSGSPPDPPTLIEPVMIQSETEASWASCIPLHLSWRAVDGAENYHVQVDDNSDFSSLLQEEVRRFTSYGVDSSRLTPPFGYYWRVRAGNIFGWSNWSAVGAAWGASAPITEEADLISPPDGVVNQFPINLVWSEVPNAGSYRVYIDDDSNFPSPDIREVSGTTELSVSDLTPGTTYYWRVQAFPSSWGCPQVPPPSSTWSFIFYCPEMYPVSLFTPTNNAPNISLPAQLLWYSVSGGIKYQIQVDVDTNFDNPVIDEETTSSNYSASGLAQGRTYYWRVRASNGCMWGQWSQVWQFASCAPIIDVALQSPSEGGYSSISPTLTWDDGGAIKYQIQVDDNEDFSSLITDTETISSSYSASGLTEGTTYYWRVRAFNGCSWGEWSPAWHFATCFSLVGVTLRRPTNGADICDFLFEWLDVDGAIKYQIQIDNNEDFSSPTRNEEMSISEYTPNYLPYTTILYWRVRAHNGCNWADWSPVFHFATPYSKPVLVSPQNNATNVSVPLLLEWRYYSCDVRDYGEYTRYKVVVDDDWDLSSPEIDFWTDYSSATISGLEEGTIYYWSVKAMNHTCEWSGYPIPGYNCYDNYTYFDVSSFTTFCPLLGAPDLLVPSNNDTNVGQPVIFDWADINGATKYQVQVDDNADFSSPEIDEERLDSDYFSSALTAGRTYYWRVRSWNHCGWSDWSIVWTFSI